MKKRVVIMASAALFVELGATAVGVDLCTVLMAMGLTWTSSEWG
jgi:hypothetical protein